MACFFYALAHMRLPDAVLLNYSLPLFMPFVEALWLGEPFPRRLWGPVGVGFAGIVLILKPGLGVFQPVALVGVLAALFAAVAQVGMRQLTRTEPLARIIFYFGADRRPCCPRCPPPLSWRTPQGAEWWLLLAIGAFGTLGQLLLTARLRPRAGGAGGPVHLLVGGVRGAPGLGALEARSPTRSRFAGMLVVAVAGILALRIGADPPQPAPAP